MEEINQRDIPFMNLSLVNEKPNLNYILHRNPASWTYISAGI